MSDELITWLRQQIDDDERVALAEVEAKRRIVDLAWHDFGEPGDGYDDGYRAGLQEAKRAAVLALAQPYAGREGWQEQWRV